MTKQEATEQIAELIKSAHESIVAATEIANESGVSFYWDGPSGCYNPLKPDGWESSNCYGEDDDNEGWENSYSTC